MIAIGITGSFCSGKTFVLRILSDMGYRIFSADEFVRDLYKDTEIQSRILELLPSLEVFDKLKLAKIIFNDEKSRESINEFIHPLMLKELEVFKWKNESEDIVFAEIPLLFEVGFESCFDFIITTFCSEDVRMKRAKTKKEFDKDIYDQIEMIQISQDEKKKKADFIINTDVDIVELNLEIKQILEKLKQ